PCPRNVHRLEAISGDDQRPPGVGFRKPYQPVRIVIGQLPKQDPIYKTENRRVCPNPQGKYDDRKKRESWVLRHKTHAIPNVLKDILQISFFSHSIPPRADSMRANPLITRNLPIRW